MRKIFHTLTLTGSFLLTGCGALPWNDQNYAGLTHIDAQFTEAGKPVRVRVWHGKEGVFEIKANLNTGELMGKAEVWAFEGQRLRAAVEKGISDVLGEAAPEVVESVVRAVLGTQALHALGKAVEGSGALEAGKLKLEGEKAKMEMLRDAKTARQ